ncbi:hypothetical protein Hypma_004914 [Hypsizygus marmoreus]|uniref:Uncharacterized protein n=1 Tax=Hypsizygus marmoreus TaxID=39966 RepID=A0A369K8J3_HYPMA|nr:hypothetical protein Hypma_004914 [Hypsizygus marmoreus]
MVVSAKVAKEPKEKKPRVTKAKKAVEKEEDEEAEADEDENENEDEAKKLSSGVAEGSDYRDRALTLYVLYRTLWCNSRISIHGPPS